MAEQRKTGKGMGTGTRDVRYQTYGNVAYQPVREGNVVRDPTVRPKVQPRKRIIRRPQVEVRTQEAVAPFAIVGFAAVALCAVMLLMSYVQLAVVNAETVALRGDLDTLKTEEKTLLTQYELAYDLTAIEQELISSGKMVRAEPGQVIYVDLSEEDSVTYYEEASQGISGLVSRIEHMIAGLLE